MENENFAAWIGKTQTLNDKVTIRPIAMMQAILNQADQPIQELPHLYHWLYFLPTNNQSELAEDGHPHKGDFLPPIPFPKRMWAGGRLKFIRPILLEQNIQRESKILKVEFKQGKSGSMYFVTVQHQLFADQELAIIEEHDIVYREVANQISTTKAVNAPAQNVSSTLAPASYRKQFPVDSTTLFRYSAVTFNAHRIHYDRPYCIETEGYPGLVVHGPLLATLLIHHFKQEHPHKTIQSFDFRAVKPVFDFNDFNICGNIHENTGELWIEHINGDIAMHAQITFQGDE